MGAEKAAQEPVQTAGRRVTIERLAKAAMRRRIEGIQHIGTIHRYGHDRSVVRDPYGNRVAHSRILLPVRAASKTASVTFKVSVASRAVITGSS